MRTVGYLNGEALSERERYIHLQRDYTNCGLGHLHNLQNEEKDLIGAILKHPAMYGVICFSDGGAHGQRLADLIKTEGLGEIILGPLGWNYYHPERNKPSVHVWLWVPDYEKMVKYYRKERQCT